MIDYLDSSSLVKLLAAEPESADVDTIERAARHVASSRIAYVEGSSAIARRQRAHEFDEPTTLEMFARLDRRWRNIVVLEFDEHEAGRLASLHALRGADAVHVASALALRTAAAPAPVRFVSHDVRQRAAAAAEGLVVES